MNFNYKLTYLSAREKVFTEAQFLYDGFQDHIIPIPFIK